MRTNLAITVCLLLCLTGCVKQSAKYETEKDMAVREMLFRYAVQHDKDQNIKIWFVDYGDGQDPPAEFLKRFSDMKKPVKKISEGTSDWPVCDKKTGQTGARVTVKINKWIDDIKAEVEYNFFVDGTYAYGGTLVVQYENGKWVVIKVLTVWKA